MHSLSNNTMQFENADTGPAHPLPRMGGGGVCVKIYMQCMHQDKLTSVSINKNSSNFYVFQLFFYINEKSLEQSTLLHLISCMDLQM